MALKPLRGLKGYANPSPAVLGWLLGSSRFPSCCSIETSSIKRTPLLVIFTVCRPIISEGAVKVDCNQYPSSESPSLSFSLLFISYTWRREIDSFNLIALSFINSNSLYISFYSFLFISFFIGNCETKFCHTFETIDTHLVHGRGNINRFIAKKKYCFSHSYSTRWKKSRGCMDCSLMGTLWRPVAKYPFVSVFEFACEFRNCS